MLTNTMSCTCVAVILWEFNSWKKLCCLFFTWYRQILYFPLILRENLALEEQVCDLWEFNVDIEATEYWVLSMFMCMYEAIEYWVCLCGCIKLLSLCLQCRGCETVQHSNNVCWKVRKMFAHFNSSVIQYYSHSTFSSLHVPVFLYFLLSIDFIREVLREFCVIEQWLSVVMLCVSCAVTFWRCWVFRCDCWTHDNVCVCWLCLVFDYECKLFTLLSNWQ